MGLRGTFRFVRLRSAFLQRCLLAYEIGGLAFRGLLRFLRDQRATLGLCPEPFHLLGLDCRCVARCFELLQFFRPPDGPDGTLRFERLPGPKEFVFLRLEFGEAALGPAPGGFCLGALGGMGFRLGLQL